MDFRRGLKDEHHSITSRLARELAMRRETLISFFLVTSLYSSRQRGHENGGGPEGHDACQSKMVDGVR